MRKTLENIVKGLIYVTFLMPLVVLPSSYIFPFIVPKILFFRTLVEIMLGAYILLLVINWQEYKPKFTWLNIALFAFLLSFGISTFVGTDAYHSFWDNHERMLGLFTILHYGIYYYICSGIFKGWADWRTVLKIFLLAGTTVMFIGILQTQNPGLLLNQGSARVASTLGNAIYVGGYGLFLAFVAYLLAIKEKNPVWRWIEIIAGAMAVMGLFFSGTRGSMLGLGAGIGVAIIGYIIFLREQKKARLFLGGLLITVVIIGGLLYAFRQSDFVQSSVILGRTFNTSLTDVMESPRWIAWVIAVEGWKERPVFGWGPNNYFYAFNAHYNPRSLDFGYGETWFDNAHNIIVNTLCVQGAFGLITYLSIFILGILSLIIARRKSQLDLHIVVVGSAFLVAHLVQNITVFENPTSYLYFMFWLAMVNSLSLHTDNTVNSNLTIQQFNNKNVKPDKKISIGLISVVSILVILLIFIFNIQPSRANKMTLDTIRTLSQSPLLSIDKMKASLNFASPHIDDIRADIGRTAAQILGSNYQKLGADRSKEILDVAYNNLQKNLDLHPLDIRNQLTLAQMAQLAYQITNNAQYFFDADKFLSDALAKSPRRQQIVYSLAMLKLQLGQKDLAVKMLEGAISDNPKIGESYWRLAYIYKVMGDINKAKETIALAEKNNIVWDDQAKTVLGDLVGFDNKK
ncbi:MAG: Tetratricopeptide repeat domain protein [Candidatus Magasanikbacteria bacterium GW2011_GWA2_37_8]|uniref:Tetratricopeptide repeat domain protein n=1 Tax=Candidatus Magasanikbacteria bacterium GW2011_GWA2_37_8 TaxID=1619036 RepID=A0A0G0HBV6_9BACT|nr:MAG: Tetratricopeptide repeat domain protein [Candidatus Magasanikbacteria bacterium GW2011_GWA2_37_8]